LCSVAPGATILETFSCPEDGTMSEKKQPRNYSPHQQKIIKRYYDNQGDLKYQRLAELVGELYLAEGKKKAKAWADAAATMVKLGVPQSRIDHLLKQGNPALVAELVKELEGKK
jgi:hypothetical protein